MNTYSSVILEWGRGLLEAVELGMEHVQVFAYRNEAIDRSIMDWDKD